MWIKLNAVYVRAVSSNMKFLNDFIINTGSTKAMGSTAHRPELIFHIINMSQGSFVSLSVVGLAYRIM